MVAWWGRKFDHSIPVQRAFFLLVEISSRTLIPISMAGSVHSGSASLDDCDRMFPDKLRVSSFPDRFQNYARTQLVRTTCFNHP